jgi:alkylation response protein AidB-like acyl-CoA dehydrogenase
MDRRPILPTVRELILSTLRLFTVIILGWHSDMVIVCAKTDVNAKGSKGISLFLVDANIAGFKKGRKLKKLGLKV